MFHEFHIQNGPVDALGAAFSGLRWWPAALLEDWRYREQSIHLAQAYPGSQFFCGGEVHLEYRSAYGATLEALRYLQSRPAQQYHLLRAAVLHEWVGNARCRWPSEAEGRWPSEEQVSGLYARALDLAGFPSGPWRYPQVHCLPELPYEVRVVHDLIEQDLRSPQALSDAVDAQVLRFLSYWAPVCLHYGSRGDDILIARIKANLAAQRARAQAAEALERETRARLAAEQAAQVNNEAPSTTYQGPIDWPDPERLKLLVWSKPLREVAKDFGVSDVAVKKACRKRGIETPPRGYWLSVERRLQK